MTTPDCYESNEDGWCDGCDEFKHDFWPPNSPALACLHCPLNQSKHCNYTVIENSVE